MDQVKTKKIIFKILNEAIQEIEEKNVVQVITDNASNCVGIGNMIMETNIQVVIRPLV
jgi:hypothetical protein